MTGPSGRFPRIENQTERDVVHVQLELPGHGDPSSTPPCQHNLDRES